MNKTLSVMGLARKAGKLLIGHDAVMLSVRRGDAKTVIVTSDASPRHRKELEAALFQGKTVSLEENMSDVYYAIGNKSCIFAVEDSGFAKAIDKSL